MQQPFVYYLIKDTITLHQTIKCQFSASINSFSVLEFITFCCMASSLTLMAEFRLLQVFVWDTPHLHECPTHDGHDDPSDASGCIKNNFPPAMVWQMAFLPDNKDSKQQHLASSQEPNCLLSTIESFFILLPLLGAPISGDTALQ